MYIKQLEIELSLDEIYNKKSKGAYIRSRANWIEQSEKFTSYFPELDKIYIPKLFNYDQSAYVKGRYIGYYGLIGYFSNV